MTTAAKKKPTAADRLRRTSPAAQAEVRAVSAEAPRMKPYKLTVNLQSADYDGLRDFAHQNRLSHQAVLERLVQLLLTNPSVATEVRSSAITAER